MLLSKEFMANEQMAGENLNALRDSIFEARSAYTLWKGISYSRSNAVVSPELAERYVKAQKTAPSFFIIAERSALLAFVILILHPIDTDRRAFSLFRVDKDKTVEFVKNNKDVIDALYLVRNKVFAHKDSSDTINILVPSIEKIDLFFENIIKFYNSLTSEHTDSVTNFDIASEDLIHEIDHLLMNITRGESARLAEIDIEWLWEKDPKNISTIFGRKKNM